MDAVQKALEWLDSVYHTCSPLWTYYWLEPSQVPGGGAVAALEPGEVYFTLTLQSMRVVDVRRGLTRFYGVVQSHVSVPHLSGMSADFSTIIAPDNLKDVDSKEFDRIITVGRPLVGPIPYYGGIDTQIGLFSVASEDLAIRFIALLESISKLAGVSFISTAMPYVEALRQGISLLTELRTKDSKDSILEIGLSTTFQPLKSGWFFVMRAPKGGIDPTDLRVTEDDYRLVDSAGEPVEDYPYMVFQVSPRPDRTDDWFLIPELKRTYAVLQDHVRQRRFDWVEESLAVFKATAFTCNDLIESDQDALVDKVESRVKHVMGRVQTAKGEEDLSEQLPPLKEIGLYG